MTALAVPHVVEQIGSYAGFAAVVGLAVLTALYISQARDVRRLREWAGRAPERAAEQAARGVATPLPGRTVTPAQPVQAKPAQGAPATAAANAPAAGTAPAAAGAAPATAVAGAAPAGATPPATAAAAAGTAPAAPTEAGEKDEPAKDEAAAKEPAAGDSPPEVAPVPVATGSAKEAEQQDGAEEEAAAASNGAPPEAPAPPPPRPAPPLPRRTASLPSPRPSQTAIPPRPAAKRTGRRGPDPRYVALAVVGVLVLGAGAAIGIPKLLDEDEAPPAKRAAAQPETTPKPSVAPDEITVSVLNGTTVPGLAAQVGDQVENEGFVLGNVTNASDQQRAESVVMYAPGHTRDARLVARRLRMSRSVEPVDPESQGLAGDATVVVVVGQDQTR